MIRTTKRILAVLCVLGCLLSCMSLAVSAEAELPAVKIGYDETQTDVDSTLRYDIDSNTLTMRAGKKLRLTCQGELPEGAVVAWTSDDADVVTIDDNGVVTTGKKCSLSFRKLSLNIQTILPMETPSIPIPCFKGNTVIKMTVSDSAGNAVTKDVKIEVYHSFFDFIRYKLGF